MLKPGLFKKMKKELYGSVPTAMDFMPGTRTGWWHCQRTAKIISPTHTVY